MLNKLKGSKGAERSLYAAIFDPKHSPGKHLSLESLLRPGAARALCVTNRHTGFFPCCSFRGSGSCWRQPGGLPLGGALTSAAHPSAAAPLAAVAEAVDR